MVRKYRNSKFKLTLYIIVFIISILFYFFAPKDTVKLHHCIDGDTAKFNIKGKLTTVRFLAINAPEIAKEDKPAEPYGNASSEFTCDILKNAKEIKLEYEKEKMDKHGRTLAWVFVDNKLLNAEIARAGFAKVAYLYDKYKYTEQVKHAEKEAKLKKLNLWK